METGRLDTLRLRVQLAPAKFWRPFVRLALYNVGNRPTGDPPELEAGAACSSAYARPLSLRRSIDAERLL